MLVIQLKETDYNTKITEIENKLNNHNHDKYITTPEFNRLTADVFNRKITKNKSKNLLDENKLKKLKTFDLSYFSGKNYFKNDGMQNIVFQPMKKYFRFNPVLVLFQNGNLKDCLIELLSLLTIALPQCQDLKVIEKGF